ncbi:DUF5709 domain-containing protein [Streptomyces sp. NPDC054949]|uniref:DUF5709 domain-containing protein n=1 Tax=unclassified Streptomyces TaxID=2593676 RepID=UPI00224D9A6A|nr:MULTISPECIES: DUF5709 domain-containing protein [unclassified Streptomyces]MCX5071849.1 DUF5709 domain-containing protein [Streptomyces sp. NBC_00424]MCX5157297.1 DUF5709 domain-containing protein [Streptomyces sp. NBC_00291]WUD44773.1 DUF5709 domain-containing protein [Streptomyces sp. NBC_00513]
MSESDARGDDVYQPQPDDERSEEPDMDHSVGELDTDARLDQGYSPPERPYASDRHATTGEEQQQGESLDERLAREVPDVRPPAGDGIGDLDGGEGEPVDPQAGDARAGRLAPATDSPRENNVLAHDVGVDAGAASAEEAAVHVIEDPEEEPR